MSRLALPADVRLTFDPTMSATALSNDAFLGTGDDVDAVDSIVQNAESAFYQQVPEGYRLTQLTRYETHAVTTDTHNAYKSQFMRSHTDYTPRPAQVDLNHSPVMPIDSAEGDVVEIRKGMNEWEDVTANSDDEWELLSATNGLLLVDFAQVFLDQGVRARISAGERHIRLKYRYGAAGGDIQLGGQTTLDSSLSSGDTPDSQSVADASKLPPAPFIALVFGEDDPAGSGEYVRVEGVDTDNDTINIASRGERLTTDTDHGNDHVVHYAPLFVRDAVSKRAAIDLTQADDYSEWLPDTDIPLPAPRKIDEWRSDWQDAISLLS